MKNKFSIKRELPLLIMIIITFAISFYFYPQLPERIPTHWNFRGEIDGYSNKLSGILIMPIMNLVMYVMFLFLPALDPKKENYKLFESTYIYFRYLFLIFFICMHIMIIAAALGYMNDTGRLVMLGVSLLFMLMGNVMGRLKHNYFVGVKTPWTLANEEVWTKTHRLAAKLWTAGGLIGAVLAALNFNPGWIFLIILILPSLIPVVYSYIIFNRLKNRQP